MTAAPTDSSRRARLFAVAALILLPLVWFLPAVAGRVSLAPGDVWISNLGVRVLLGRMIAHGQLPLWNPYIFGGMPLLANVYTGAIYPPNWLFAVFSPAVALNALMITTIHLSLIGTYLFARRLGMERLPALVSGIVFAFSGFSIAHLDHIHRLTAVVWLPWILLAIEQLFFKAEWRWIALGAVFVALQLFAGDPQMTLYTAMLGAAYALFSLCAREQRQKRWRFIAAGAAMSAIGLLLSLAQLLPEAELLGQGERAGLTYEYFAGYSLPPRHLVALIFPYFFGGASLRPYSLPYRGEWNEIIPCGYVGLLGLMLIVTAWLSRKRDRQLWFWTVTAIVALALAFGGYLPFGLNRVLYHVPVYNLFRGSYRHWLEFTFAAAMLSGFGVSSLRAAKWNAALELVKGSAAIVFLLVLVTAALYLFGKGGSLADAECFIPIITFAFSAAAVWFYASRPGSASAVLLVVLLLADLATFGWFFTWRSVPYRVNERLADSATVAFIKARETDLSSFRLVSQSALPYDYGYEPKKYPAQHDLLNVSNSLIPRGLQSVNGYDLFRPLRVSQLLGDQDAQGIIWNPQTFGPQSQALNLLNVRYLLLEKHRTLSASDAVKIAGVSFAKTPLHLMLAPGRSFQTEVDSVPATELAIISLLSDSVQVPDQSPVVRIRLHTRDRGIIERELQAGRDTSEWAWERPDVRKVIRHRRAQVAESTDVQTADGGFQSHTYLSRTTFDRAEIERIEFEYLRPDAQLQIVRASLTDAQSGAVTPLDDLPLQPEQWQKLATFSEVQIYQNLRALPRAWFADRVIAEPETEVLRIISSGRLRDGQPFDPRQSALVEAENFRQPLPVVTAAGAKVKVTRYEPNRIELTTRNEGQGFLVLSEIFAPGWQALIDSAETTIHRTDYALRGIVVPAGAHRIEFIYRPRSFRNGVIGTVIGAVALLLGFIFSNRRKIAEHAE
ncbi:MAG TPA: YfhO family protein [Blastocatellia bacterium]|nr:YfhO family protein [Blastocatellia bacterium]